MEKAIVLLSSGLDSSVNFYEAKVKMLPVLALFFNYGQKANIQEETHARKLAQRLDVEFQKVDLNFFADFPQSSLTNAKIDIVRDVAIDDLAASQKSAKNVWVPNRNGIFLNIAAGYAESLGAKYIIPGFNLEEAATFPDNSEEFMLAASKSLAFSTSNQVELFCFTTKMNKTEIYKRAIELKVDFDLVWPCYYSGEQICGHCESCLRFERARSSSV